MVKARVTKKDRVERCFNPAAPLTSKNALQADYITCIKDCPITVATGYPGTGKTYIPARIAAHLYKTGQIDNIILSRPPVSASNSLGFFKGTKEEKMKQWLAPVLGALKDEFSPGELSYLLKEEVERVTFVPIEVVKGQSWKNSFVIIDEAEDCTLKELKSILTRIGANSRIVLCGDVGQTDLRRSGLAELIDMCKGDARLRKHIQHVDFNDPATIVRSDMCREMILGFERAGK